MPILLQLQNYRGKGMECGEKSVFASFFGCPEYREFVEEEKSVLRHPKARAASYYLLPDTL